MGSNGSGSGSAERTIRVINVKSIRQSPSPPPGCPLTSAQRSWSLPVYSFRRFWTSKLKFEILEIRFSKSKSINIL